MSPGGNLLPMPDTRDLNLKTFNISVVGETTGETFRGDFDARILLSHRDRLRRDRVRRDLLGAGPEGAAGADQEALLTAEIFSQLTVRVAKAPKWWDESGNGLDLRDHNVITEVYKKVLEIEAEARKAREEASEAARQEMKSEDAKGG